MSDKELKEEALNTLITMENIKAISHFTGKNLYYQMSLKDTDFGVEDVKWLRDIDIEVVFNIRKELLQSKIPLPSNLFLHYAIREGVGRGRVEFEPPRRRIMVVYRISVYEDAIDKFIEEFKAVISWIIIRWKATLFLLSEVYKIVNRENILQEGIIVLKDTLKVLEDTISALKRTITENDILNKLREPAKEVLEKGKQLGEDGYYEKKLSFDIGQTKGIVDVDKPTVFDSKIKLNVRLYYYLKQLKAEIGIIFYPFEKDLDLLKTIYWELEDPIYFDIKFYKISQLRLVVRIKLSRIHLIQITKLLQQFIVEET